MQSLALASPRNLLVFRVQQWGILQIYLLPLFFAYYLILNSKWGCKSVCRRFIQTFFSVVVLLNATNASCCLNCPLVSKGVKTKAFAAVNSSFIGQSTSATIIDRDLPQPKSGPKIAPKKGTQPPKSTVARPASALNALKAAPKVAPKATPKAALKAAPTTALKTAPKATVKGATKKRPCLKLGQFPLSG